MPTRDRRAFVPGAIDCFLRQDQPGRELVIVDDGDDPVADLVPPDDRLRYVRLEHPLTVGAKRNLACELAGGDVIAHWDDDDWHDQRRLSYQLGVLRRTGADVVGLATLLHYEPATVRAWRYGYPAGQRVWLAGTSLLYRRTFWNGHRFADVQIGEDSRFVRACRPGRARALADHTVTVALIHAGNTCGKQTADAWWDPYPVARIRRLVGPDWPVANSPPSIIGSTRWTRS